MESAIATQSGIEISIACQGLEEDGTLSSLSLALGNKYLFTNNTRISLPLINYSTDYPMSIREIDLSVFHESFDIDFVFEELAI